ncbi:MAG: glycoside hydrolase family 5 protein, partial [Fibrobacter sp.]|nr:glycoside hydrolase family 5 protein [Fibrobacter sp.]
MTMATALCMAAVATNAFATIQPKRVGPVSQYGALQAGKNAAGEGRIYGSVDGVADGKEVQVRGMSLTWSQYWPYGSSFYGNTFIDTLVGSWNVELIRSAMGAVPPWGHGGYMTRPEYFESQMDSVVQAAIENDVYVLIDWHSEGGYYNCIHKGVKPTYEFNDNKTCFTAKDAADFFGRMAERYGKYPHVIFEIYNEPVSESWNDLKAYADTVIAAIRPHSKNLVVVGTPMWSSMAGEAVKAPLADENVAYTYHFYANLHKTESHLKSSNDAMAAGLSVFV